jgi:Flp pilus assembly pilin Flp
MLIGPSARKVEQQPTLSTGTMANFGQKQSEGGHGTMDKITEMFVKVREYQRGQTMAEYALILSAVAVVVFVGYETMGTTITTLLNTVDGKL